MKPLVFDDCLTLIDRLDKLSVEELKNLLGNPYLWDNDFDELVFRFILQVIYEQKLRPDGNGIGSTTETKFLYRELLYERGDLNSI